MNTVKTCGSYLLTSIKPMPVYTRSLYNKMDEFGIPKKLIDLTKMCMGNTQYQVRVDTMSEVFEVRAGLKQGDTLSPMLFNIAMEKTIREMQRSQQV